MTTEKKEQTPKKEKKPKGPIRWEALIPFSIVSIAVFAYFHFFFDLNLRQGFQWAGYHIVGAEVDIADVDTSFFKGTFAMKKVEVTNPDKPSHNLIEIGDIRFGLLWDGLLRAKVVIEEMAVEKIEIGTSRKFPGKVKPPEPPPTKKEVPSALEKEATKLKEQALEKTKKAYSQNVLGDIAAMLSGTSSQDQLGKIEDSLPSKAKLLHSFPVQCWFSVGRGNIHGDYCCSLFWERLQSYFRAKRSQCYAFNHAHIASVVQE